MRNSRMISVLAFTFGTVIALRAGDFSTVDYPYLGVTHIFRVGSTPDFPRNVNIHVIKIDLTAPYLSFKYAPHEGTRDTVRKTTLQFLNDMGAQIAINGHFFLPFPSSDLNSALVGFAASNGTSIRLSNCRPKITQFFGILRPSTSIPITMRASCIVTTRTRTGIAMACARLWTGCKFWRTPQSGTHSRVRRRSSPMA